MAVDSLGFLRRDLRLLSALSEAMSTEQTGRTRASTRSASARVGAQRSLDHGGLALLSGRPCDRGNRCLRRRSKGGTADRHRRGDGRTAGPAGRRIGLDPLPSNLGNHQDSCDVIGFVSQFFSSISGAFSSTSTLGHPSSCADDGRVGAQRSLPRAKAHGRIPPGGVLHDNSHSPGERVLADRRYGPRAATRTGSGEFSIS
jgi:hypothetical protein